MASTYGADESIQIRGNAYGAATRSHQTMPPMTIRARIWLTLLAVTEPAVVNVLAGLSQSELQAVADYVSRLPALQAP